MSRSALRALRRTAVERIRAGERQSDVLRDLGLSRTWLARQLDLHKSSGPAALDRPARGSRPSQLTLKQLLGLLRAVIRQDLLRKSRTAQLWSCETLAARLPDARHLKHPVVTLRRQLAQFGIAAPLAPWKRKRRELSATVRHWLKTGFEDAQKEATRLKAPLWYVKIRSVKALPASFKEFGVLQLWLAANGRGELHFAFARAGKRSDTLTALLRRLLANNPRPSIVVVGSVRCPFVLRVRGPARHSLLTVVGGGVDAVLRF